MRDASVGVALRLDGRSRRSRLRRPFRGRLLDRGRSGLSLRLLTLEARLLLHLPLAALHFLRIATIVLSHGAQDAHAATATSSARRAARRIEVR